MKPVLAGTIEESSSGSILRLRYRAPVAAYVFYLLWYSILGLATLMMLGQVGERNPGLTSSDIAAVAVGLVGLGVVPIALHFAGTRKSDEDLGHILDFLAENAGANA